MAEGINTAVLTFAQFIIKENVAPLSVHLFPVITRALSKRKRGLTALNTFIAAVNSAVEANHIEKKETTALQNQYLAITGGVGEALEEKYPKETPLPVPEDMPVEGTTGVLHPSGKLQAWELGPAYRSLRNQLTKSHYHSNFESHKQYTNEKIVTNPYAHLGPKWASLSKLYTDMGHDWTELEREYGILVAAIVHVQTLVPTKASKAAAALFKAPQATKDARSLVERVLIKMTNEIRAQYESDLETKWLSDLEDFFEKSDDEKLKHLKLDPASIADLERRNREQRRKGFKSERRQPQYIETLLSMVCRHGAFVPDPNWKSLIQKQVKIQAAAMQAMFVEKNLGKLTSIVERKGNIDGDPKIMHIQSSKGAVEGEMEFKFKDGSSFRVRNKVVWQMRYSGTSASSFNQFPTTFHDAVLPNGKRMSGQPSEREMNSVFAVATR